MENFDKFVQKHGVMIFIGILVVGFTAYIANDYYGWWGAKEDSSAPKAEAPAQPKKEEPTTLAEDDSDHSDVMQVGEDPSQSAPADSETVSRDEFDAMKKELASMLKEAKSQPTPETAVAATESAERIAPQKVDPNAGLEDISVFPADIDGNVPEVAVSDYKNITGSNPRVGNNRWTVDVRTGKRINVYESDQRTEWARSLSERNVLFPFAPGSVTYVERDGLQLAADGLLKLTTPTDPPLEIQPGYQKLIVNEDSLELVPPALQGSVRETVLGTENALVIQAPIAWLQAQATQ